MDRQTLALVAGFFLASVVLWGVRRREPAPQAPPASEPGLGLSAPSTTLKAPRNYPESLAMFAETNRGAAEGVAGRSQTPDVPERGAPRLVKKADAAPEPIDEAALAADLALPDDPALAALAEPSTWPLAAARGVGLAAAALLLAGGLWGFSTGHAVGRLWSAGGAAAVLAAALGLHARAVGSGGEALFWTGFGAFGAVLVSRKRR